MWNSSITKKNKTELERVQKVAVSIITKSTESYSDKLKELNLDTLKERRNILSARFAEKCTKNEKTKSIFKENINIHNMKLRKKEKFIITHANTVRLKRSAIPNMTKHLNKKHEDNARLINNMKISYPC